jgi:Fe-S-cluster containining protein
MIRSTNDPEDRIFGGPPSEPAEPLDVTLLSGFRFGCLPGCGLCCFTTPAVDHLEAERLRSIEPEVPLARAWGHNLVVGSRPRGGACFFLTSASCRCHSNRPFPCAEFPLTVHVGARAQTSVVLSCPGIALDRLDDWSRGTGVSEPPIGLDTELVRVRAELRSTGGQGLLSRAIVRRRALERRLTRNGLWHAEDDVRRSLRGHIPLPSSDDFPPKDLPPASARLEELPLFHDERRGRVALRRHGVSIELFSLRESGGIDQRFGVYGIPSEPPPMSDDGRRLLLGYLSYCLERDETFGVAYARLLGGSRAPLMSLVADDLREIGAQVLTRALWRRELDGIPSGPALERSHVEKGIRATDMDFLDRPTAGLRL